MHIILLAFALLGCHPTHPEPATRPVEAGAQPGTINSPFDNTDELARYVQMALEAQAEATIETDSSPRWTQHRAWYVRAREAIGMPISLCRWDLYPTSTVGLPFEAPPTVRSAICDGPQRHCVAWLEGRHFDRGEIYEPLHLVFDEHFQLRATALGPEGEAGGLPELPPGPAVQACDGMFAAMVEDRIGEDFFSLEGGSGEPLQVERHCGERATEVVRNLGDEWSCDALGCVPLQMCGNTCSRVAGVEVEGRVLAVAAWDMVVDAGDSLPHLRPEAVARWRDALPCGGQGQFDSANVEF